MSNLSFGSDEFKVAASEEMRRQGYRILGGDNLLFGEDESGKAEFQLGATITALNYDSYGELAGGFSEATLLIEWQLYDMFRREVVFLEATQGYARQSGTGSACVVDAFRANLSSLMAKQTFVDVVHRRPSQEWAAKADTIPLRYLLTCRQDKVISLPEDLERVMAAVIVIHAGGALGSGVVISPDGYAVTAGHVVSKLQEVTVQLRSGLELSAQVITVDAPQDVALIKLQGKGHVCASLALERNVQVGEDLYAIGAPAAENLAFSVSKGIVSGIRQWENISYLQTDASLNPGNSGGPLVTRDGRVAGVVSWKIAGGGFEGLAFGVPGEAIAHRLGIVMSDSASYTIARSLPPKDAAARGATAAPVASAPQPPKQPPVTVTLTNGTRMQARSIHPASMGTFKVVLLSGKTEYIDGAVIRSVFDSSGTDRTRGVLENRERIPAEAK